MMKLSLQEFYEAWQSSPLSGVLGTTNLGVFELNAHLGVFGIFQYTFSH